MGAKLKDLEHAKADADRQLQEVLAERDAAAERHRSELDELRGNMSAMDEKLRSLYNQSEVVLQQHTKLERCERRKREGLHQALSRAQKEMSRMASELEVAAVECSTSSTLVRGMEKKFSALNRYCSLAKGAVGIMFGQLDALRGKSDITEAQLASDMRHQLDDLWTVLCKCERMAEGLRRDLPGLSQDAPPSTAASRTAGSDARLYEAVRELLTECSGLISECHQR